MVERLPASGIIMSISMSVINFPSCSMENRKCSKGVHRERGIRIGGWGQAMMGFFLYSEKSSSDSGILEQSEY